MTREVDPTRRWKLEADALAHSGVTPEMLVQYAEGESMPPKAREAVARYLANSQAARDELAIIESWRVPEADPPETPASNSLVATLRRWLWNPIPAYAAATVLAIALLFRTQPPPNRESLPAHAPATPGMSVLTAPSRPPAAPRIPGNTHHQFGVQQPMGSPDLPSSRARSPSGAWIMFDLDDHDGLRIRRDQLIAGLVIEAPARSDASSEVTIHLTSTAREVSIQRKVAVGPEGRAQLRIPSEWLPAGEYQASASMGPDDAHPFATRRLSIAP